MAVLGATGLVGEEMMRLLEGSDLPISRLDLLASERSAGREMQFKGEKHVVQAVTDERLADVDYVLASAGGSVSKAFLPKAAEAGTICVDNTSAFRMEDGVPLVVPEVNGHHLDAVAAARPKGAIIANPNCSTIQLVVALAPLQKRFGIRRGVVSTYQSVSGAGRQTTNTFHDSTRELLADANARSGSPFALDALPKIGDLDGDGISVEEMKMVRETPKILEADVPLDVTCVRVPVTRGHAETVFVETEKPCSVEAALEAFREAPGIEVLEDPEDATPRQWSGKGHVAVSRVRRAHTFENGLQFWVVADNLLKGAAGNAVQILDHLVRASSVEAAKS